MPQIVCTLCQSKEDNNCCGAYALVAIAKAFELLPVEQDIELSHDLRNSAITKKQTEVETARSIYAITGNLSSNGEYLGKSTSEYNSPSALSYVARQLGLSVDVKATANGWAKLRLTYQVELNRCEHYANSVDVSAENYVVPTTGKVHLICVANHDKSLHWIAQGTDGLYYDPAYGTNENSWDSPVDAGSSIGSRYKWTGFWMVFGRNP